MVESNVRLEDQNLAVELEHPPFSIIMKMLLARHNLFCYKPNVRLSIKSIVHYEAREKSIDFFIKQEKESRVSEN